MNILLSFLVLLGSLSLQAGFYGELDYSVVYSTNNEYTTGSGLTAASSGSADLRFLGPGIRYIFNDLLLDNFNIEPYGKVLIVAKDRDNNELSVYEVGSSFSYSIDKHQPFVSIMALTANDPSGDLSYETSFGYQIGYRYHLLERHMVYLNHAWRTLKSENPAGDVFDQKSDFSSFAIGYGYRFF